MTPIFHLLALVSKSGPVSLPWYYDFGWNLLLVMGAGIMVAITGIRAIFRANHPDKFWNGMLLHGLSILAAVALGLFAHLIGEWWTLQAIAETAWPDHSLEALDRMVTARLDMLSCGVIFFGAVLGGIATIRMARHHTP